MKVELFTVAPSIPEKIRFLETLANNTWWTWQDAAIDLFRRINPQLWRDTEHNALAFLNRIPQKRLEGLANDEAFLRHLEEVEERFNRNVLGLTGKPLAPIVERKIAYFSLEYGIHESIRLYSGGLGVLAADHLKAASDLNLPLVAVGLLYRQGFFQQYLNEQGIQQERYPENEMHHLPLRKACREPDRQIEISLPLPEGELKAIAWQLDVGRIPLILLDANIPQNPQEFREITAQLYGGNERTRLRQELLLGIGGFRALLALGMEPEVCHINEGHAAFLNLARISHLVKDRGLSLDAAIEVVPRTNVFTTHTPVPAGNEVFHVHLLKPHLEALQQDVGIGPDQIINWGKAPGDENSSELSMTILGLRMARSANGVSRLHGEVARRMWKHLWPEYPEDEIPIVHVTNGVHVASFLSRDNGVLYDRYLGRDWSEHSTDASILTRVSQIPDDELWRAHELGRSRLVRFTREYMEKQMGARNASRAEVAMAKSALDHDALTIGFARRFATYKRANLLLKDPERFKALLNNEDRPVQFVFSGKAHPADMEGKELIREIIDFSAKIKAGRKIVFLENYNLNIARYMLQGVDVWLNTPRRPKEASGTSGMKACVNGALHLSVLDGWWAEGYAPERGWAIGGGEEYDDPSYQDAIESQALFNLLENEVIPCFYNRPLGDLPAEWIKMMKASIKMALRHFTSHRMVGEYTKMSYEPAMAEFTALLADNAARVNALVEQRKRLEANWADVKIEMPHSDRGIGALHSGDSVSLKTTVRLGALRPEEVDVQVYYGPVDSRNVVMGGHVEKMVLVEEKGNGVYIFEHKLVCEQTGRYGLTARVTPEGVDWKGSMPGFITWANGN